MPAGRAAGAGPPAGGLSSLRNANANKLLPRPPITTPRVQDERGGRCCDLHHCACVWQQLQGGWGFRLAGWAWLRLAEFAPVLAPEYTGGPDRLAGSARCALLHCARPCAIGRCVHAVQARRPCLRLPCRRAMRRSPSSGSAPVSQPVQLRNCAAVQLRSSLEAPRTPRQPCCTCGKSAAADASPAAPHSRARCAPGPPLLSPAPGQPANSVGPACCALCAGYASGGRPRSQRQLRHEYDRLTRFQKVRLCACLCAAASGCLHAEDRCQLARCQRVQALQALLLLRAFNAIPGLHVSLAGRRLSRRWQPMWRRRTRICEPAARPKPLGPAQGGAWAGPGGGTPAGGGGSRCRPLPGPPCRSPGAPSNVAKPLNFLRIPHRTPAG